jgi:hypothetical protein
MRECPGCGGTVESVYRFCPWCAVPLRLKLVEFFRGHADIDGERALRVSRYVAPRRHVRFSVWLDRDDGARAEAAVSLDDEEAARLARFLDDSSPPVRAPSLLERLYSSLGR